MTWSFAMSLSLCIHSRHLFNRRTCRGFYEDNDDPDFHIFDLDSFRHKFIPAATAIFCFFRDDGFATAGCGQTPSSGGSSTSQTGCDSTLAAESMQASAVEVQLL